MMEMCLARKSQHFFSLVLLATCFIAVEYAHSASYIAISNADIKQQLTVFDTNLDGVVEDFKGTGPKAEFGYFLTNAIAMELSYTQVKFEEYEGSIASPPGTVYTLKPQMDIITYGLRWYMWEWLNFKVGGSRSTYDPKLTVTPSIAGVGSSTVEDSGSYYGFGLGLTFKKIQLFFDTTYFPKAESENPIMTDIGLRVFF